MNYYNEWDKGAAAWLRELIKAKLIPDGVVDERSITEVKPADLTGFTQCHFFCGIGGWPLALQLAGVPSTQPLWTGSPPCQPFSVAGGQVGFDDPRHLAPALLELIAECRPPVVFGEQVAAAIGKHWVDFVFIDLEAEGYTCGAAVLPACSVGAPHKRDRLFFGATLVNSDSERHNRINSLLREVEKGRVPGNILEVAGASESDQLADTNSEQRDGRRDVGQGGGLESSNGGIGSNMADTDNARPQGRGGVPECSDQQPAGASGMAGRFADASSQRRQQDPRGAPSNEAAHGGSGRDRGKSDGDYLIAGNVEVHPANPHNGFWSDADWLGCRDGKFRPVEASAQQMVDGISDGLGCSSDPSIAKAFEEIGFPLGRDIPARVARLRGYGNAIVPPLAAIFIKAFYAREKV